MAAAFFSTFLLPAALADEVPACAECHEGEPDVEAFVGSVHGGFDCVDCHSAAAELPHGEGVGEVDCSSCHDDVLSEYAESAHGQARAHGEQEAPGCETCHGNIHTITPHTETTSPVHATRLAETCGNCHADPEKQKRFGIPFAKPIEAYRASVHARLVGEGIDGANCSSCHGSHDIRKASDPASSVNHQRVPETCGRCHRKIADAYEASVHGVAAAHGVRESPVCTDCHGEHRILGPDDKGSPVYATNLPKMTCGRCHGDLRMAEKYGIQQEAVESYADSYHGLASRAGAVTVANCASCHGVHDIQPSSDPRSHIHPDNLAATCGSCHPGAGTTFAIGEIHVLPTDRSHPVVYWARAIYLWLIWVTIGGMLVHNALDLWRKTRSPLPRPDKRHVPRRQRMATGFRVAHGMMMVNFVTLVYSGFALKYPEAWWAAPLLRWEDSFSFRGWVHRGAAIVMLAAFVFHFVHLIVDRHARSCIRRMAPTWHDVTELRERLEWMVGKREKPPHGPVLGYAEKAEYLALIWGTIVMAVTGFVLWFENPALRMFPKWVTDLSTVIHFYEAILATLAILVWHFYFVIFDPVIYPMDTAWLTGREAPGRTVERDAMPPRGVRSPIDSSARASMEEGRGQVSH